MLLGLRTGAAGLDEVIRLLHAFSRKHGHRLQNGVGQFAGLDRSNCIRRSVEATDHDVLQLAGLLQRRDCAQRHFVVAADHTLDVRVRLHHRLHLVVTQRAVPVGNFSRGLVQVGVLAQHRLEAVRTGRGVVVGRQTDELDVLAFLAHRLDPLLRTECGALCVVRNELRLGQAFLVDFGVDQDNRDVGRDRLLHRTDRTTGVGRIKNDRNRLVGDGRIDQLALGVRVTGVGTNDGRVAHLLGGRLGDIAFGEPVRVGRIIDDDRHQTFSLRHCRAGHERGENQSCNQFTAGSLKHF